MNCISTTGRMPHVRRAGGRADDRRLGDRRVDHALLAELGQQPLGDLEGPPNAPMSSPRQEDALVARHLLVEPLADGLEDR